MVGKRTLTGDWHAQPGSAGGETQYQNGDIETGTQRPKRFTCFKDAVNTAVADQKRQEIKAKLMEGVNPDGLDKYRKSDEEVREIHHLQRRMCTG